MSRFFYSVVFVLLTPLFLLAFLLLSRRQPLWRTRLRERFGWLPSTIAPNGIWLHAASVGEVMAAAPLIKALRQAQPSWPLCISTFTPTGALQVEALFGRDVQHCYVPLDLSFAHGLLLRRLRPRLLIIIERELWPNMLAACARRAVPVLLANARLSEKSLKSYQRFPWLVQPMLNNLTQVAVQNSVDGERYLALGLPAERLEVTGSVKFDIRVPEDCASQGAALRQQWGQARRVLALASSHEGEDEYILKLLPTLQQALPDLLLVLVPRHLERFAAVADCALQAGFCVQRRSEGVANADTQVYIADTMGEMLKVLAAADLVLMGGSLIERGGHNPIEPAALGKAVLIGPSYFNFSEIVLLLQQAGALQQVSNEALALTQTLIALLRNPDKLHAMGQAGYQVVAQNRGAVKSLVARSVLLGGG